MMWNKWQGTFPEQKSVNPSTAANGDLFCETKIIRVAIKRSGNPEPEVNPYGGRS